MLIEVLSGKGDLRENTGMGMRSLGDMYTRKVKEEVESASVKIGFFHSLFGWLSLLAAFKYWVEYEGDSKQAPTKAVINGKLVNLEDIEVVSKGKRSSLLVNGMKLTRSKVSIAGILYEVDGKLVLDTNGDYYTQLDIEPEYLYVESNKS